MTKIVEAKAHPPEPALSPEEDTILSLIERVASDPTIDLDRVEKFLDMHAKIKEEASRKAFNAAMAKCQKEMPQIIKDAYNEHTQSNYATLTKIDEMTGDFINDNGFAPQFSQCEACMENHYALKCLLTHVDGYEREYRLELPIDNAGPTGKPNKSLTHGASSAMTYVERKLTCLIFKIATKDNDGNQGPVDTITQEQADNLRDLIESTGANEKRFLNYAKCRTLEDIPAASYDNAVAALNSAQKKRQGSA